MEFAKEHCLNTSKSEVAKRQKVRSTKRKFCDVRRARNKNEFAKKQELGATEREPYMTSKNDVVKKQKVGGTAGKGEKFGKKLRGNYNKILAAKKQESMEQTPLLMYRNRKGLVQSYNTTYKNNGDCVTTPYVFDCDTKRIVKEGYLNEEPSCENALPEKKELEADSDVATRVDETSG